MAYRFAGRVAIMQAVLLSACQADLARCYWPGGTQVDSHTPCNESASASHCCVSSDACISNGYCFQQGNAEQWGNRLVRASCTDPNFEAPECTYYCGDIGQGYALALLLVNNTANGSFCCSDGYDPSTNRCNMVTRGSNKAFQIQPGQVIWDRRTGSIEPPVNGTVYATVREVSTATIVPTATGLKGNSDKTMALVVGIAVPLGALLILAIISLGLIWRRLKHVEKLKDLSAHEHVSETTPSTQTEETHQLADGTVAKHEAEACAMRHELVNEVQPVEISAVHCWEVEGNEVEGRRRL